MRKSPMSLALLVIMLGAGAMAVDVQARGGRGGGHGHGGFGGKPVAAYPGAKPTTPGFRGGAHHPGRGFHPGHVGGRGFDGAHRGRGWRGHDRYGYGYGNGYGNGQRWHYRHGAPWWGVGLGVGIGVGLGWPYWSDPWDTYYPYRAGFGPVYEATTPVYVNPLPMPSYGSSFRYYCPASAAYYPDVSECRASWLKVIPDEGVPPPVPRDEPVSGDLVEPSSSPSAATPPPAGRSQPASPPGVTKPGPAGDPQPSSRSPVSTDEAAGIGARTGPLRIAAPRMAPPAQMTRSASTWLVRSAESP